MASGRIFIGSATESRAIADQIASALAAKGHRPIRWWKEFKPGDIPLDRILALTRQVDGAIFLALSADKTWYREKETMTPRDNVMLEYGAFVSHLNRRATVIVSDTNVRLPTDVLGITSERIVGDDIDGLCTAIVNHFEEVFFDLRNPTDVGGLAIVADPDLLRAANHSDLPSDWGSRALYFGMEGARGWLAVAGEAEYIPQNQMGKLARAYRSALVDRSPRTLVSFGPGDAHLDEQIISFLHDREELLRYIPVDISDGLLHSAVQRFSSRLAVPVGILADFESGHRFVREQIGTHAARPLLIGLLGNTLGNLDRQENIFLHDVRGILERKDFLLIDVSLAGRNWTWEKDRKTHPDSYPPGERRFLATAIARVARLPIDEAVDRFSSLVSITKGQSDVPGTHTVTVRHTSGKLIVNVRRYDFESLKSWLLEKSFAIVYEEAIFDEHEVHGDAVFLLARTKR